MSIKVLETKHPVFPQLCTGCGSCSNICPQKAITMKLDSEGFYKPFFDDGKCISCGRCMDICPVLNPEYKNSDCPKCLAFMASDETRLRSSSGGAFEILAKKVIEEGGLVCGVAYTEDFLTEHILIDSIDELHKIRGSKYIMSNTNDVFSRIKQYILDGRKVLFSGCPCQVAGLTSFLGSLSFNENLIMVDLICHGIPSVKAFGSYLNDVHANHKIKHIGFKEKEFGWHASMTIEFEDIDRYNAPCEKDTYFWSYLSGINKNKSCGDCKFARIPRQGDITIGDFWGISTFDPNFNDGKGTSVVLLNNKRGVEYWNSLDLTDCQYEEAPLEAAIAGNTNIVSSPKIHVSRTQFFKNLGIRRFDELSNWCSSAERYDIGLVGIPIYVNWGGTLTYYSLYCLLEDNGFKTLMISRPRSCGRPPIMPEMVFEVNPYPNNVLRLQLRDKDEMSELNNFCETFLVGSDQLFNADLYYRFGEMITLDWVTDNHRKIAYAASFGHDVFWGRDEQRATMAHYMQKFDAFSVREEDGIKLAKEYFGVDAEWVLDPVFLCDKKHYLKLAENTKHKSTEKHIFSYILDSSD
ncbi:MAG: 4Fe-4S dicluster domain-containing protein [Lachnospiraceae bacterium]|nr:4Fe-4S dicluster domain-containing protein [Lachnospiraceae bacterium]